MTEGLVVFSRMSIDLRRSGEAMDHGVAIVRPIWPGQSPFFRARLVWTVPVARARISGVHR